MITSTLNRGRQMEEVSSSDVQVLMVDISFDAILFGYQNWQRNGFKIWCVLQTGTDEEEELKYFQIKVNTYF